MRVVFGLGNPGIKYRFTRHNIGFLILDSFAEKHNLKSRTSKWDYMYSEGSLELSDFFLIKPTTFMNLSGNAVADFFSTYNCGIDDMLVIVDDVNLELGKIRLRKSGSDGGHNGLKSIIYQLQSNEFPRLRFGVGKKPSAAELADYVLDKFDKEELDSITENVKFSVELVEKFISGGYKSMSDHFSNKAKQINPGQNAQAEELP